MKQIQTVSDSELILLRIIWAKNGTALYAEIAETLAARNLDWKKNTIITLLSRLVEKGLLATSKIGRRNEYRALVTEEEYGASQAKVFVDRIYEGNVSGLINTLIRQDMVSEEEKQTLRRFWERSGDSE